MIKTILKPFRSLLGLDLLNDEIGKKLKEIENFLSLISQMLEGSMWLEVKR